MQLARLVWMIGELWLRTLSWNGIFRSWSYIGRGQTLNRIKSELLNRECWETCQVKLLLNVHMVCLVSCKTSYPTILRGKVKKKVQLVKSRHFFGIKDPSWLERILRCILIAQISIELGLVFFSGFFWCHGAI